VGGRPGPWLVLNGDLATDVSLVDVLDAHRAAGADVTAVGVDHLVPIPFGVLRSDEARRIQAVVEKPVIRNVVSAGINVVGADARTRLGRSGPVDMTELLARCVADGLDVRVYPTQAEWFDVGTATDYARALRVWDERCSCGAAGEDV
jgi:NDP-sugar pyrophosphorylase family protein